MGYEKLEYTIDNAIKYNKPKEVFKEGVTQMTGNRRHFGKQWGE